MQNELVFGGTYRHYKNKLYVVLDVVRHSETLEEMVLYEALYENELGRLWVRPKAMFLETITGPDGPQPRFELVSGPKECGLKAYKIVLQIAAILLILLFLYLQIGPFLNWFGNKP
jgi:hypothetical protein